MCKKGRRTDEPEDTGMLAVEGLGLRDIGQSFIEPGGQLRKVGDLTERQRFDLRRELYEWPLNSIEREQAELDRQDEVRDAMTKTPAGLRKLRGNYDYWERVAAQYALTRLSFTQRRTTNPARSRPQHHQPMGAAPRRDRRNRRAIRLSPEIFYTRSRGRVSRRFQD